MLAGACRTPTADALRIACGPSDGSWPPRHAGGQAAASMLAPSVPDTCTRPCHACSGGGGVGRGATRRDRAEESMPWCAGSGCRRWAAGGRMCPFMPHLPSSHARHHLLQLLGLGAEQARQHAVLQLHIPSGFLGTRSSCQGGRLAAHSIHRSGAPSCVCMARTRWPPAQGGDRKRALAT